MTLHEARIILAEHDYDLYEASVDKIAVCRKRVKDHIDRVKYFYKLLVASGQIPLNCIDTARVQQHDADKLEPENLRRQALRFSETGEFTEKDKDDINQVVIEHIKSNPHHCEYWGAGDHRTVGMDCSKMEETYLYEMAADWAATSEEKGGNLVDWAEKHINTRWKFDEWQVDILKDACTYLQDYIKPELKRDYGLTYVDPVNFKGPNK